jgi:hypothetical protein
MQVDPVRPTLKPPGIMLLKLIYNEPLSNFAFDFNLRRYTKAAKAAPAAPVSAAPVSSGKFGALTATKGGKGTMQINQVGRCRLTLSNSR